jgi:hypothetical protein
MRCTAPVCHAGCCRPSALNRRAGYVISAGTLTALEPPVSEGPDCAFNRQICPSISALKVKG